MTRSVVAEVKAILFFGRDAADDAGAFAPADPNHFGINVQVLIGETGNDLADSFDLVVCSPSWFAAEAADGRMATQGAPLGMPQSIAVGSGVWFMVRWDHNEFEAAVRFLCETYSPAPDWGSLASRIGRQIPWESTTSTTLIWIRASDRRFRLALRRPRQPTPLKSEEPDKHDPMTRGDDRCAACPVNGQMPRSLIRVESGFAYAGRGP